MKEIEKEYRLLTIMKGNKSTLRKMEHSKTQQLPKNENKIHK